MSARASAAEGLGPDDAPLVAEARRLAAVFAGRAAAHDRDASFPHRNVADLHAAGLLRLTVPREAGGHGAGLDTTAAIVRTLGTGDPSTGLVLVMQALQHATLARSENFPQALAARLQREAVEQGALVNALRVEPDLGTPARGGLPATLARRTPEGWRVSGRKINSTGAPALAWGMVFARSDEAEPRAGFVLVPMSAPGVRIEETWDQLGQRASGSHDVVLDDVLVPHDHAVDLRPAAAWAAPDPLGAAWITTLLAALYDGVARAAQDWFVGFLKTRAPANLGAPLATLPRFQEAVGENERLLAANARLVAAAAADADAGRPATPAQSGLVKLTVTENAIAVVQRAVEFSGNPGLSRANPLERHLRDVLCARVHTPQGDAIRLAAGRAALGL